LDNSPENDTTADTTERINTYHITTAGKDQTKNSIMLMEHDQKVVPHQNDELESPENDATIEVEGMEESYHIHTTAVDNNQDEPQNGQKPEETRQDNTPHLNDEQNKCSENDAATETTALSQCNKPAVNVESDIPTLSSRTLLDHYEQMLKDHLMELGVAREVYLHALAQMARADTIQEATEHDEVNAKLKEAMRVLESSSRSKRSIVKESSLPEEAVARSARVKMWKATLGRKASASKLLLLEQELRSLECIVPILRTEQQACHARLIQPKCNPAVTSRPGAGPQYADLEPVGFENHFRIWVDPDVEAEDLFLVSAAKLPRYHSTAMQLPLEDDRQRKTVVRAVVDSGAAWSAIDEHVLRTYFSDTDILPSDRKFKDASGNIMKVVGRVPLYFFIGDLRLSTMVYVFKGLGAPFLLGVNSLHAHQLGFSTQRRVIFSEHPLASAASKAPIEFMQLENTECDECHVEEDSLICRCAQRNQMTMHCEIQKDRCCVVVTTPSSGERTIAVETEHIPADPELLALSTVVDSPRRINSNSPFKYSSKLSTDIEYIIHPTDRLVEMRLYFDHHLRGEVQDLRVTVDEEFRKRYGDQLEITNADHLHSSLNYSVFFLVRPLASLKTKVKIPAGIQVATASLARTPDNETASVLSVDQATPLVLRTILDPPASPANWQISRTKPMSPALLNNTPIIADRCLIAPGLLDRLKESLELTAEEWAALKPPELQGVSLRMSHHLVDNNGDIYQPAGELKFDEGGRPRNREDLHKLGFTLDKAVDPSGTRDVSGNYPPLSESLKVRLYDMALRWYCVWSRDAKTPELSRLVVIDVPTGDTQPIAQRPYPIPFKYLEAVRKEIQKLLDGGLIEPCISSWASPILVRLKKDSTPDDIRLKIIVDYRRLNEVTIPDAAGLGSQDEILHGFGGSQRYCGIVDAAGGFYQFLVNPAHRFKTAFCLPTSMGGTSFQWRVAPYGLTRNPAGYSRGMMYALKGLANCDFGPNGTGGAASWIDDVSMHADSFDAFAELFETILQRIAFAGMSLKASKCYLLHQKLEVLGYFVTPDGLVMQDDKLDELRNRYHKDGKPVGPVTVKEIRTFLGTVQFYKRFIPRLALLSAPMNAMLKQYPEDDPRIQRGTAEHEEQWKGVQESYEAIMLFLQSSAVVSAPDFQDPLAEFVICPDACNIAVGGVLLQWQWPIHGTRGPGPPAGVPLRAGKGTDPLTQSWRLGAGWKLRTIDFLSKTLSPAQQNYPTFDKEAAAIVLSCRKWAQLITSHPTTVYTDSSVAATMLTKHLGQPRLQRWGMELGTFLPHLKIQHRRGIDNGMADFLSRFPTFERYIVTPKDIVHAPDGDFADVAEVPLFTHRLTSTDDAIFKNWRFTLVEDKDPKGADTIWQGHIDTVYLVNEPADVTETRNAYLEGLVSELGKKVADSDFWKEQREFDAELHAWKQYLDIFHATHGRLPVVYDLYCGEGGFSRGARSVGCECYGFDINTACAPRYETEPSCLDGLSPSCMTFLEADVSSPDFWDDLKLGYLNGVDLPRPDLLHASPPCTIYARFARPGPLVEDGMASDSAQDLLAINGLIEQIKDFQQFLSAKDGRPLIWQVENVPESRPFVQVPVVSTSLLCGTMMGHQLFRHRLVYSNYALVTPVRHSHDGKYLYCSGARSNTSRAVKYFGTPTPNMYGIYSQPSVSRQTASEWHGALGALPGTYSSRGIVGCLPSGYGRLTASQMIAHSLHQEYGCPVWPRHEATALDLLCLSRWATIGYKPIRHDIDECHTILTLMDSCNPATTAPATAPVPTEMPLERLAEGSHESPLHLSEWRLPDEPFDNTFIISKEEQRRDPELAGIARVIETTMDKSHLIHSTLHGNYVVRNGLLYHKSYGSHDLRCQLCVPHQLRSALMYHYHYSHHAGKDVLASQLARSYWWPNMHKMCLDFTNACMVCGERRSGGMQSIPTQPIPTPSQPFSVIHVDHKGPLPLQTGSKNTNILVVVCALTRFCVFIPCQTTTAVETMRLLVKHVFCVFGTPAVMVSDNGPAFLSGLAESTSKYFGYRHIHTLPYNPQANGAAEAAVKRIKLLLDRQTHEYKGWEKLLPLSQHMLNTTVHTSIGITPYQALFGREPIGLEQLENPALYPDADGDEFLRSIRQHMLHLHSSLTDASDSIKNARIDQANKRGYADLINARRGTVLPSTPGCDRYVWLLYGSKENATYLRKHGHGAPWRHKYKVLEVRPHAVRLEVPKDGSVPQVMEWQCMRRVAVAHADEHGPTGLEPYMTEYGYTNVKPGLPCTPGADGDITLDDDELYDIERIVRAERIGNRYRLWIKWTGHDDITSRWKHELVQEISDPIILASIDKLVDEARDRAKTEYGHLDEEIEPDQDATAAPNLVSPAGLVTTIPVVDDTLPIAQRLPARARVPPKTYTPILVTEATATDAANTLLCDSVHTRLCNFLDAKDDPNYFFDT